MQKYENTQSRELNFTEILFKELRKTMGESSVLLLPDIYSKVNGSKAKVDNEMGQDGVVCVAGSKKVAESIHMRKEGKECLVETGIGEVSIQNTKLIKEIESLKKQRASLYKELEEFKEKLRRSNEEYKQKCDSSKLKAQHSANLQNQLNFEREKTNEATTLLTKQLEMYEEQRRQMHKHIQQLKGNIRVFCRVKPIAQSKATSVAFPELIGGDSACKALTMVSIGKEQVASYLFDCVFPPSCSQKEVFEEVAPFLQSSLDGENVCIFAYGQTGSGKTYTMEGPSGDELFVKGKLTDTSGVLPRAVHYIFTEIKRLEEKGYTFKVLFSAIEVYNEDIRDMLNEYDKTLSLISSKDSTEIKGLIEKEATNLEHVITLMKAAAKSRRTAKTSMNERSSRSHSIYRVRILVDNPHSLKKFAGMLNIIDLAGSERAAKDGIISKDETLLREARFINQSLTTLGRILTILTDRKSSRKASIPYRESKLTRILQNSLQFESKTLMFVNICPSVENMQQSKESLRFASTASLVC
eukprot:TRINITY_DN5720_c0_g1_i2.p1 TRINITY_DN5720_c0_g1~~TRINITY_DN5720_c0_g1_i2.p1  ORF type:complete len:527 (+),score=128.48 TRINITY_DN5720_c0_g1_i2:451-2031(+)